MGVDLIVGIDVGMSATGVAYHQPGDGGVKPLLWGKDSRIEKVPSKIAYADNEHLGEPLYWGLNIPSTTDNLVVKEWFKTDLGRAGADQEIVEKLFVDYLKLLHTELSTRLTREVLRNKSWAQATIQFVFSAPTTWSPAIVHRYGRLISTAGFDKADGAGHGSHTAVVSLVEPHATAALQLCPGLSSVKLEQDQHIMVVDVGAGTSDFCRLRIGSDPQGISKMCEGQPPAGLELGSGYIDQQFERRVHDILEPYEHLLDGTAQEVAYEMRCGAEFQDLKHQFGRGMVMKETRVLVPRLKNPQSSLGEKVQNGALIEPEKLLKPLFEQQVRTIKSYIGVLADTRCKFNGRKSKVPLDYVVLSGGFGGTPYVMRELVQFCGENNTLKSAKVVACDKPRLVVCMGLVYHAIHTKEMFPMIACRSSFGLRCRIPNTPSATQKCRSIFAQLKQFEWPQSSEPFVDCVDWFLKKGTEIENGKELTFEQTAFFKLNQSRVLDCKIVVSPASHPSPLEQDVSPDHFFLRVNLSGVKDEKTKKKKIFFWRKERHIPVNFCIKAQVGLAQAHFFCVDEGENQVSEPVRMSLADSSSFITPLMGLGEVEED